MADTMISKAPCYDANADARPSEKRDGNGPNDKTQSQKRSNDVLQLGEDDTF
jgi:hypothetical protein